MNAAVVVHRELLVASRRSLTWWMRVVVGAVGLVFALAVAAGRPDMAGVGHSQLRVLGVVAFLLVLFSGVRYTALPLSEENRNGTLGLVLLTPLRRGAVLFGKLGGGLLETTGALLVLAPMLMLPVVSGGVTAGEVVRLIVVLFATQAFSLGAGLYVGARHSDALAAAVRTAVLVLWFCLPCGWLWVAISLAEEIETIRGRETLFEKPTASWQRLMLGLLWLPYFTLILANLAFGGGAILMIASPVYVLVLALTGAPLTLFACQVAGILSITGLLLALARARLASVGEGTGHGLEIESLGTGSSLVAAFATAEPLQHRPVPQSPATTRRHRRPLRHRRPVVWLLQPPEWVICLAWGVALIVGCRSFLLLLLFGGYPALFLWDPVARGMQMLSLVLHFLVAWQAARLFAESRHSGALELLLVTPYVRRFAISDQWRALRQAFAGPVSCMIVLGYLGSHLFLLLLSTKAPARFNDSSGFLALFYLLTETLTSVLGFLAVAWLAIWRAWSSRQPEFAATHAFFVAALLPMITFQILPPLLPRFLPGVAGYPPSLSIAWLPAAAFYLLITAYCRRRLRRAFETGAEPVLPGRP